MLRVRGYQSGKPVQVINGGRIRVKTPEGKVYLFCYSYFATSFNNAFSRRHFLYNMFRYLGDAMHAIHARYTTEWTDQRPHEQCNVLLKIADHIYILREH